MIRLCNFIEYGCNNGVSIKDSACQQSYPEKQKIVSYLKNEGKSECKIAENKYYNQYRTKRKIHFVNSPLDLNQ